MGPWWKNLVFKARLYLSTARSQRPKCAHFTTFCAFSRSDERVWKSGAYGIKVHVFLVLMMYSMCLEKIIGYSYQLMLKIFICGHTVAQIVSVAGTDFQCEIKHSTKSWAPENHALKRIDLNPQQKNTRV